MDDTAFGKRPLQSKKFVGFIIFHLSMMGLAAGILAWAWHLDEVSNRVFLLLLSIIVVSGFVATGFILGVASLDKYLGLAQIAVQGMANGTTHGPMNRIVSKGTKGLFQVHEPPPTTTTAQPPIEEMESEDELDDSVDSNEGPDEEMKP